MAKDGTKVVDEVARQAMWSEVIKKENATIGVPHRFFLNPNKLVFIARKPTEVDPRTYEADALSTGNQGTADPRASRPAIENENSCDNVEVALDASSAKLWKTESQRWGNFYTKKNPPGVDPFSSQRSCWRKPRSKCDVTEYGDRYCEMTGVSPYARKYLDSATKL
ncbi:unnamed protein product [Hapterophycus canaliculatus]